MAGGADSRRRSRPGARVDVLVSTEPREGPGRSFLALEDVELLDLAAGARRRAAAEPRRGAAAATATATLRVTLAPGGLPHRGTELRARGAAAPAPAGRPLSRRAVGGRLGWAVSNGWRVVVARATVILATDHPTTSTPPSGVPSSARSAMPMKRPCSTTPGTRFSCRASSSRSASSGQGAVQDVVALVGHVRLVAHARSSASGSSGASRRRVSRQREAHDLDRQPEALAEPLDLLRRLGHHHEPAAPPPPRSSPAAARRRRP